MDSPPNYELATFGMFLLGAGLSGVLFPDFWARANSNFNGMFGMSAGPGGNPGFVRGWSAVGLLIGAILVAAFVAQIVF